ncbi:MAG TPA: VOC family protein [Candidatus Saccharimonadales bacterium]|nr:VOC family protein [Candidatus Saccharimonadales bacterium]
MKILHTCLNVSNMEKSIDFYSKSIGLTFVSRREIKENNAEIAFLKDETGNAIELTHWRDKKLLAEGDNFDHIAFQVDDIHSAVKELKSKGVTIAMEPYSISASTSKIAFIKDPDGNWLELIQKT